MLGSLILIPLVIFPAMGGTYNFKHIMKELQGAVIIGFAFQAFLGYSGLMTILIRKHVSRMKYCRADTSDALGSSSWSRFPYPLQ
ncbi:nucleobase-ascorbate transporter 12-like [Olea europaea var. sylvestris]|uniref:nucleobase-ascorbate transporter 12-like n=1 Tax=Olea europaea var. sylvestris TaxID=158386 RepID=UPI000C1CE235|nr:nucleobase-ascorbate transporter 12-like [Olea europaea var. sylvestris]